MFFFWIILGGILVYSIYLATNKSKLIVDRKEDALDILKKRYASGEIGKKEYEEKKKDIIN